MNPQPSVTLSLLFAAPLLNSLPIIFSTLPFIWFSCNIKPVSHNRYNLLHSSLLASGLALSLVCPVTSLLVLPRMAKNKGVSNFKSIRINVYVDGLWDSLYYCNLIILILIDNASLMDATTSFLYYFNLCIQSLTYSKFINIQKYNLAHYIHRKSNYKGTLKI